MKLTIFAILCGVVAAQGTTAGSSPACPANKSPYCCSIRATPQSPSTGCSFPPNPPANGYVFFSDCANRSLQATCCTSLSGGKGNGCQVYQP